MLRKIRITISILVISLISFFIVDFAGLLPMQLHFLEEIQLIPALLALNWAIIITLIVLTFIFGRIYCSSVCPLGIWMDITSRIRKWVSSKKKRKRYKYTKALNLFRYGFLALTIIAFFSGFSLLVGLLDPYSAFSRFMVHVFKPAYLAGHNLFSWIFSNFGKGEFLPVGIYLMSVSSLVIALFTLGLVTIMAWRNGRIYCNSVCPVGTTLGVISKYSLLQIKFNPENCTSCGKCARVCKASCIDVKKMQVDTDRCINCYSCTDVCGDDALHYQPVWKKHTESNASAAENHKAYKKHNSRRKFLQTAGMTVLATGTLLADRKLNTVTSKLEHKRKPVMPPGALNFEKFTRQCTSCHLCITKCPTQVIRPAYYEYGLAGMLQPVMDFKTQYCDYTCTMCTDVCPTDALTKLTEESKKLTQIGLVQLQLSDCVVKKYNKTCTACSDICPTAAVVAMPYQDDLFIPEIDQAICVGCGACESVCPAKPLKAIWVEGLNHHQNITLKHKKVETVPEDDFGF